jgi:hypothetical protein
VLPALFGVSQEFEDIDGPVSIELIID